MIFVLDNYDSFTYNLVQYIGELGEKEIVVKRNDELTPDEVVALRPSRIILSPGPCTPQDAGILVPLIKRLAVLPANEQIPTLGVFRDLPQPMTCTRYHSLIVREDSIPDELEISARVDSNSGAPDPGTVM